MTNTKRKSKSVVYQQADDDWRPRCNNHASPLSMAEVVVRFHYPRGWLPARGFRCKVCGNELLTGPDVDNLQALAKTLGMYGLETSKTRRLVRTGGSLAVTLDPELLRQVVGDAKAGTTVRVGRVGNQIVIEAL